jgi:hypothetical protein
LLGNQAESQNWAGYAATAGGYTAMGARWHGPDVTPNSPPGIDAAWWASAGCVAETSSPPARSAPYRIVAAPSMRQILQRASMTVPLALGPGDSIEVSISQQGPETWLIALTNTSSGRSFRVAEHYASSLSSV